MSDNIEDRETKNDTSVGYGSMYMDSGEKYESAEHLVREVSEKSKPFMFFFDIICTPNQVPAAQEMAVKISHLIEDTNPDMKMGACVVGITTKDKERTAQTLLQRIASQYKGDKLQGLKLDDGRHFIYVDGEIRK